MIKTLTLIIVVFLAVGGSWWYFLWYNNSRVEETAVGEPYQISGEIEELLNTKITEVESLTRSASFVKDFKSVYKMHESISQDEIQELDAAWVESQDPQDEFISDHLNNVVSDALKKFQSKNVGYVELFVTDERGLNIGQTNITSDFNQKDEEWWINAYAEGVGKTSHGIIEFDQSAQSESMSLYVPIRDKGIVIGIMKAVIDLEAIRDEIYENGDILFEV